MRPDRTSPRIGGTGWRTCFTAILAVFATLYCSVAVAAPGEPWSAVDHISGDLKATYLAGETAFNSEQDVAAALALVAEGQAAARGAGDDNSLIWFLLQEIRVRFAVDTYNEELLDIAQEALTLCLDGRNSDPERTACEVATRYTRGLIYVVQSKPVEAMADYSRAAAVATELGNEYWIASVYSGIGFVMMSSGEPVAAVDFFRQAMDASVASDASPELHTFNLAVVLDQARQWDDLVETVGLARQRIADSGKPFYAYRPVLDHVEANALIGLGQIEQARPLLRAAREGYEASGRDSWEVDMAISEARIALADTQASDAIGILGAVRQSHPEDIWGEDERELQALLSEAHAANGDYEQAYAERLLIPETDEIEGGVAQLLLTIKDDYQTIDAMARAHERTLADRDAQIAQGRIAKAQHAAIILAIGTLSMAVLTLLLWRAVRAGTLANRELTDALAQRDTLFREVNHRVKNNLQLISSILSMQRRRDRKRARDGGTVSGTDESLKAVQTRVQTMALIHQKLYRSETLDALELASLFGELSELVVSLDSRPVALTTELDTMHVSLDDAVPLGLILCELLSNALKHSRQNNMEPLRILVRFTRDDSDWSLSVSDSGPGLPHGVSNAAVPTLGMTLIQDLAEQVDARIFSETSVFGGARIGVARGGPPLATKPISKDSVSSLVTA